MKASRWLILIGGVMAALTSFVVVVVVLMRYFYPSPGVAPFFSTRVFLGAVGGFLGGLILVQKGDPAGLARLGLDAYRYRRAALPGGERENFDPPATSEHEVQAVKQRRKKAD